MVTKRARKFINRTIELEGGVSDHEADSGGLTIYGLTEKWDNIDKSLTKQKAITVYYDKYYSHKRLQIERIEPDYMAWKVFDTGINTGPVNSARLFQKSINEFHDDKLQNDGWIGDNTIQRFNEIKRQEKPSTLLATFIQKQQLYYNAIIENNHDQIVFQDGWTNRAFATLDGWPTQSWSQRVFGY